MKKKSFKLKTQYMVSALRTDSSQLGSLKRFDTEREAILHARYVIQRRAENGDCPLTFYVIKTVVQVKPASAPMIVTKLK